MPLHVPMRGRDATEAHRVSTPLELFFDLTVVVAVAQAAAGLHHGFATGHGGDAVLTFVLVFFGIWWAWMNFTWFASAYDTDDGLYRLMAFVQMTGVLVLAAGVPRAFADRDLGVMTLGYVIMRLALVAQWLRAAGANPLGRVCALRYAAGIALVQVGWVARLALPGGWGLAGFVALVAAEMVVPMWAESADRTPWHPTHVAERYGLFTLIVLGESILATTTGVQVALDLDDHATGAGFGQLAPTVAGGLLIVYSMWWIYFDFPREQAAEAMRESFERSLNAAFRWGYGHYFVFASIAATGAGVALEVDHATGETVLGARAAGAAVTVPVAVYLVAVWALHARHKPAGAFNRYAVPVAAALVLVAGFTAEPVLFTGFVLAALVAGHLVVSGGVSDLDGYAGTTRP